MAFATKRQRALDAGGRTAAGSAYMYLNEVRAAAHLGFDAARREPARRLKDLRQRGGGPRYVRIGSAVRYRTDLVRRLGGGECRFQHL